MSLELSKLQNVRERAGKTIARCPICALSNADEKAEHLFIGANGYGCIVGCDSKAIFALAGNRASSPTSAPAIVVRPRPAPSSKPSTPFAWPELQCGTASDFRQLAQLRDVSVDSLKVMSERGILRFATFVAGRAWVAVDPSLKNAQARLLSGERWHGMD